MDSRPIGIFDSGIGGLTVASALVRHMPDERLIYFGDTAHLPYGDKSLASIRDYALRIVDYLVSQSCKLVVIACNSASSAAFPALKDRFNEQVLLVNVVDPLVQFVASQDVSSVGIIATKATISSGVYERKLQRAKPGIHLFAMATPLLVPMIEEGFVHDHISHAVLEQYLSHPGFSDIEALLLACTHYPLIRTHIETFFKGPVKVWDSAEVTALAVAAQLTASNQHALKRTQPHLFCVSEYTRSFEQTARLFYPEDITLRSVKIW